LKLPSPKLPLPNLETEKKIAWVIAAGGAMTANDLETLVSHFGITSKQAIFWTWRSVGKEKASLMLTWAGFED
jgi:hypothetical protein